MISNLLGANFELLYLTPLVFHVICVVHLPDLIRPIFFFSFLCMFLDEKSNIRRDRIYIHLPRLLSLLIDGFELNREFLQLGL